MIDKIPQPGEIWQENDKRFHRLIQIVSIEEDYVFFIRNTPFDPRKTLRKATLKRFNGRNMGYSFTGRREENL